MNDDPNNSTNNNPPTPKPYQPPATPVIPSSQPSFDSTDNADSQTVTNQVTQAPDIENNLQSQPQVVRAEQSNPTVFTNNVDPAGNTINPNYATDASNQSNQVDQPVSSMPNNNFAVNAPVKKKPKLLWLWIALGVVFTIIISSLIVFLLVKSNADKIASEYTKSVNSYTEKVKVDLSNSNSINDAKNVLESNSNQVPVLNEVVFSFTSSNYANAETLEADLARKLDSLSKGIAGLVALEEYRSKSEIASEKMEVYANASSSITPPTQNETSDLLNKMVIVAKDFQSEIEKMTFPTDLSSVKADVSKSNQDAIKAIEDVIVAIKNKDLKAYEKAQDAFIAASEDASVADEKIKKYYDDMETKKKALIDQFDSLKNSL